MTDSDNPNSGNAGSASDIHTFTQSMAAEKLAVLLDMDPIEKTGKPKEEAQDKPEPTVEADDDGNAPDTEDEAPEGEESEEQPTEEDTDEDAVELADET